MAQGHCNFAELIFVNLPAHRPANELAMTHKWTKASRAKLSRTQKARWRKRKRQRRRKR